MARYCLQLDSIQNNRYWCVREGISDVKLEKRYASELNRSPRGSLCVVWPYFLMTSLLPAVMHDYEVSGRKNLCRSSMRMNQCASPCVCVCVLLTHYIIITVTVWRSHTVRSSLSCTITYDVHKRATLNTVVVV